MKASKTVSEAKTDEKKVNTRKAKTRGAKPKELAKLTPDATLVVTDSNRRRGARSSFWRERSS